MIAKFKKSEWTRTLAAIILIITVGLIVLTSCNFSKSSDPNSNTAALPNPASTMKNTVNPDSTASPLSTKTPDKPINTNTPEPSNTNTSKPSNTNKPATPISLTIAVVPDPSLEKINKKDPYAQVADYVLEAFKPDKDLYNALFNAIDKMETKVDISKFKLSVHDKVATMDSLYDQAGFQFYYLKRIKLSKDSNSALITYTDTKEKGKANKEIFYSKLNHFVYNAAPKNYTKLQKLFSVYDYICTHSEYTDNMQDSTTFTAYSILMKGKGICGGYSNLGYYALNQVGIKTTVISNGDHAWNMVTMDGENYHTDITWGVGSYGINTILMDDVQRKFTLDNAGIGEDKYPIIEGYPRVNPDKPLFASDKSYKAFYNIYNEYALDIENNWIYYSNEKGIKRMTLDGTMLKSVSPLIGTFLTTFNGILYFAHTDNMELYKLEPGKTAKLLDNTVMVESMNIKNGILHYKYTKNGTKEKTINLNPFAKSNFQIKSSRHQASITVPRPQTFKFEIKFSENMNTDNLPKKAITLVNKEGQDLPIHMSWSKNGRILTVRSQESLDNESVVSLYVAPGIPTADGQKSKEAYDLTVKIP